jgi:hypothetical protein
MVTDRINTFLELCRVTASVKFDKDKYVLPDRFEDKVKATHIPYDIFGDDIQLQIKTYFNDCDVQFSETITSRLEGYELNKPVMLLSPTWCYLYDDVRSSFLETGSVDQERGRIFRNAIAYFHFYNFLRKKDVSDYFNYANSEIVFYNSANGIIKVTFDPRPIIDFPNELTVELKTLQDLAGAPQITAVFVNAIYQLSNGVGSIALKSLINERKKLTDITKRDYELISKKFDFAKFRNSLYLEKEKYFSSIRELVNKIFAQAIGIPISIGASVFTTYKADGGNFVISLILVSFILYLIYYIRLQFIYRADINEVETQFNSDFAIIASDSGLPAATIDAEKTKVQTRITTVRTMQDWMIGFVIGLGLLASGFMISQYFPKKEKTPDSTIKELTEAIKKYNTMADSIHHDLKDDTTSGGL